MKIEDFAKKYNINVRKAKQMAPYIPMAKQCQCCGKWDIPDNAKPIYIADKRKYGIIKKYCYVLDAISLGMQINDELSGVTLVESKTIIPQLNDKGHIILKRGCEASSVDYNDYMISSYLAEEWENKNLKNKTDIIVETLKTIQELTKLGAAFVACAAIK